MELTNVKTGAALTREQMESVVSAAHCYLTNSDIAKLKELALYDIPVRQTEKAVLWKFEGWIPKKIVEVNPVSEDEDGGYVVFVPMWFLRKKN